MSLAPRPVPNICATLSSEANAWVARLTSGEATIQDAQALQAWRSRSPEHEAAYQQAALLWKLTARLAPPRRRSRMRSAIAAAAAACIVMAFVGASQLGFAPDPRELLADHHTGLREQTRVTLPDGSVVELDARTRLKVEYRSGQRLVHLAGGAAVFRVKHDPDRPFVVRARNGTVTALGTVFEVRHQSSGINVTCSEGVVGVRLDAGDQQLLHAGEHLRYDGTSASLAATVNAEQALAWRDGLLVFRNRPLQDLVDELNRYRAGRVVIADATLSQAAVSGVFHLQRPEEALRHIQDSLNLATIDLPAGITVLREKN